MSFVKFDFEDDDILKAKSHDGNGAPSYVAIELKEGTTAITLEKRELMALLTLINQKEEQIKTKLKRGEK